MWFFDRIRDAFWDVAGAFHWAADKLGDIPLIGGKLNDPFQLMEKLFRGVGDLFDYASGWAEDVASAIRGMLSWDDILLRLLSKFSWIASPVLYLKDAFWDAFTSANSWLKYPVYYLWNPIWDFIKLANPWLASPVTSLASGIWDWITSRDSWLKNPVSFLWSGIWDQVTGHNSWLKNPAWFVVGWVQDTFGDWIWDFLEDRAEDAIKLAGRVLTYVWEADIFPDEESKQSGQSKG